MGYPARQMTLLPQGLRDALAELPVFPLPELVFFPGTRLPLHIFEPRYRALTRRCLATHRAMAVTMLLPGPPDASRNPPFATVAGLGVIVEHEELPDGRFNILLQGEARVRLAELPFAPPFRRARAEELPDLPGLVDPHDLTALFSVATACAAAIRKMLREPFSFELPPASSPHAVHQVVSDLLLDPALRQEILQEQEPVARCRRATAALAQQRATALARLGNPGRDLN